MTTNTERLTAFLEHLELFDYPVPSGDPEVVILWPGIQEEPPEEGYWLEPKLFPGEPVDRSWDNNSCAHPRGFFQVKVYYRVRPDLGVIGPSMLADAIIAYFPKGTAIADVRIKKEPYQSSPVDEDASRSFIPVTIHYTT